MSSALTARGSTRKWREIRDWIFDEYGRNCLAMVDGHICGAPATTIGHVIRREHGGGDGSDNLRPQCGDCNYGETPKPGAMPATLSYTQAAIVRALDVIGVPVNAGRRRAKGALQRHAWAQSLKPRDLDLACRWRRARGPLVRA